MGWGEAGLGARVGGTSSPSLSPSFSTLCFYVITLPLMFVVGDSLVSLLLLGRATCAPSHALLGLTLTLTLTLTTTLILTLTLILTHILTLTPSPPPLPPIHRPPSHILNRCVTPPLRVTPLLPLPPSLQLPSPATCPPWEPVLSVRPPHWPPCCLRIVPPPPPPAAAAEWCLRRRRGARGTPTLRLATGRTVSLAVCCGCCGGGMGAGGGGQRERNRAQAKTGTS